MSGRVKFICFALLTACVAHGSQAQAQVWQPLGPMNYRHNLQPFETFDVKNFKSAPDPHEGFFFSYDRLSWSVPGEKTLVGNPDAQQFYFSPANFAAPPQPIQVINGLTDSPNGSSFHWGSRYELGYVVDHHGWLLSVLDGPEGHTQDVYGFRDEFYIDVPDNDPEVETDISAPRHPSAGNVAIVFAAPVGYFQGFLNLLLPLDGNPPGVVVEDIDGNGISDANDLVIFPTTFDLVTVRNSVRLDGVELMKTYRFDPGKHGGTLEFFYGARYLQFKDQFFVNAEGGAINDLNFPGAIFFVDDLASFWDTTIENHIVGPQLGINWFRRQGRWTFGTQGRFLFGYNVQNFRQNGLLGAALDPTDAIDQPGTVQTTTFDHGMTDDDFSPCRRASCPGELPPHAAVCHPGRVQLSSGFVTSFCPER